MENCKDAKYANNLNKLDWKKLKRKTGRIQIKDTFNMPYETTG